MKKLCAKQMDLNTFEFIYKNKISNLIYQIKRKQEDQVERS